MRCPYNFISSYKLILLASLFLFYLKVEGQEIITNSEFHITEKTKNIALLKGEATFYWQQFPLNITNSFDKNKLVNSKKIEWPYAFWKKIGYPTKGYGTYHLKIIQNDTHRNWVLHFPKIHSSAKVWINGELTEGIGKVGKLESEVVASGKTMKIDLPNKKVVEIYIAVSNFHHQQGGGFPYSPKLIEENTFQLRRDRLLISEGALALFFVFIGGSITRSV